jgi:hypothetical protein
MKHEDIKQSINPVYQAISFVNPVHELLLLLLLLLWTIFQHGTISPILKLIMYKI